MIVELDENGELNCTCDGNHWILVHDNSKVIVAGIHAGVTSTPTSNTIEYFNTELEMEERIVQLGLNYEEA